MAEATRLTLAGRLTEATATIQRTLGHMPIVDVSEAGSGSAAEPIEAEFRVLLKTRKRDSTCSGQGRSSTEKIQLAIPSRFLHTLGTGGLQTVSTGGLAVLPFRIGGL